MRRNERCLLNQSNNFNSCKNSKRSFTRKQWNQSSLQRYNKQSRKEATNSADVT